MENTKIKLFGPEYSKEDLENKMNAFMETVPSFYINDVSFNVVKNYLPETKLSEFQESWYGSVCYGEELEPDE